MISAKRLEIVDYWLGQCSSNSDCESCQYKDTCSKVYDWIIDKEFESQDKLIKRYQAATKKQKSRILDRFVEMTGYSYSRAQHILTGK